MGEATLFEIPRGPVEGIDRSRCDKDGYLSWTFQFQGLICHYTQLFTLHLGARCELVSCVFRYSGMLSTSDVGMLLSRYETRLMVASQPVTVSCQFSRPFPL